MGLRWTSIQPQDEEFIRKQHLFFVASAPLAAQGHINVSPKGHDTFRILSPVEVAYLDYTGSENETSAHLLENGRLTIMFMAFEGKSTILRLYGKGQVILPGTPEWDDLIGHFSPMPGMRQIIKLQIEKVIKSCGFGVPNYEYKGERGDLKQVFSVLDEEQLHQFQKGNNYVSIDGMPTPLGLQGKENEL